MSNEHTYTISARPTNHVFHLHFINRMCDMHSGDVGLCSWLKTQEAEGEPRKCDSAHMHTYYSYFVLYWRALALIHTYAVDFI